MKLTAENLAFTAATRHFDFSRRTFWILTRYLRSDHPNLGCRSALRVTELLREGGVSEVSVLELFFVVNPYVYAALPWAVEDEVTIPKIKPVFGMELTYVPYAGSEVLKSDRVLTTSFQTVVNFGSVDILNYLKGRGLDSHSNTVVFGEEGFKASRLLKWAKVESVGIDPSVVEFQTLPGDAKTIRKAYVRTKKLMSEFGYTPNAPWSCGGGGHIHLNFPEPLNFEPIALWGALNTGLVWAMDHPYRYEGTDNLLGRFWEYINRRYKSTSRVLGEYPYGASRVSCIRVNKVGKNESIRTLELRFFQTPDTKTELNHILEMAEAIHHHLLNGYYELTKKMSAINCRQIKTMRDSYLNDDGSMAASDYYESLDTLGLSVRKFGKYRERIYQRYDMSRRTGSPYYLNL